jgi:hypothetical protein
MTVYNQVLIPIFGGKLLYILYKIIVRLSLSCPDTVSKKSVTEVQISYNGPQGFSAETS